MSESKNEINMVEEATKALEVKYKPLVDLVAALPKSEHFQALSAILYKDPMYISGADRLTASKMLEQ
ncbi:MAG: hypothetical protein KAS32_25155, partial [Candidatus Peribacteraceae bacterium]|nr:hypothetical protein [Candidatus Peribacteraceae bacterium]